MKVYGSVYWGYVVVIGAEVGRDIDYGVDIGFGDEVGEEVTF